MNEEAIKTFVSKLHLEERKAFQHTLDRVSNNDLTDLYWGGKNQTALLQKLKEEFQVPTRPFGAFFDGDIPDEDITFLVAIGYVERLLTIDGAMRITKLGEQAIRVKKALEKYADEKMEEIKGELRKEMLDSEEAFIEAEYRRTTCIRKLHRGFSIVNWMMGRGEKVKAAEKEALEKEQQMDAADKKYNAFCRRHGVVT
jgi:hypothetical protein